MIRSDAALAGTAVSALSGDVCKASAGDGLTDGTSILFIVPAGATERRDRRALTFSLSGGTFVGILQTSVADHHPSGIGPPVGDRARSAGASAPAASAEPRGTRRNGRAAPTGVSRTSAPAASADAA